MTEPHSAPLWRSSAIVSLIFMVTLLAWDFSGGDVALALLWGDNTGFPLRDHWWMVKVMHEGARTLGWIFLLALLLGIWRPWGSLRPLSGAERVNVFFCVLCALLSVTLIKGFSQTSCPWDLELFGGTAPYISHWNIWQRDGGGGHCFPAGHASTGFAFMAAFFGLRQARSNAAYTWLFSAMAIGFVLGISQQIRGAHFMSHTLWTAWLCWTVGWLTDALIHRLVKTQDKQ